MTGVHAKKNSKEVYDKIKYQTLSNISTSHLPSTDIDSHYVVNIRIQPKSYLKYLAVCLNRTAGNNIIIEDLHINTYEKIKSHTIISHFEKSLVEISGNKNTDVEPKFLREWFRLCFFANQGQTITELVSPSVCQNSGFELDFENFYDGSIVRICKDICDFYNLKILQNNVRSDLLEFRNKNRYHDIDLNISKILECIQNRQYIDLSNTNIMQQAWIDNYLVDQYNIEPLLQNNYFNNTLELIDAYDL